MSAKCGIISSSQKIRYVTYFTVSVSQVLACLLFPLQYMPNDGASPGLSLHMVALFFFCWINHIIVLFPLQWPSNSIIHKSFKNILRKLHKGKFWRWKIQGRKIGDWNILGFPSTCCKLLPG